MVARREWRHWIWMEMVLTLLTTNMVLWQGNLSLEALLRAVIIRQWEVYQTSMCMTPIVFSLEQILLPGRFVPTPISLLVPVLKSTYLTFSLSPSCPPIGHHATSINQPPSGGWFFVEWKYDCLVAASCRVDYLKRTTTPTGEWL